jgi:hypothetical protein
MAWLALFTRLTTTCHKLSTGAGDQPQGLVGLDLALVQLEFHAVTDDPGQKLLVQDLLQLDGNGQVSWRRMTPISENF